MSHQLARHAKGDGTYCGDMGSTQMATGKWMDILLKADYSDKLKQGHSYLQIWINGELVCDIKDTIVNKHTGQIDTKIKVNI